MSAKSFFAGALALALTTSTAMAGTVATPEILARGQYLATIMDCNGCHTPGSMMGKPDFEHALSGGDVGFQIPGLGIFWPPNLTSDAETGLGTWSEDDIVKAVRTGVRPDGRHLAPAMPYHAYSRLTDEDAMALATFLKSLPPVANAVPPVAGPDETPKAPYLTVAMPQ